MRQTQQTSIEAYKEMKPKIGERQLEILKALKFLGLATDYEIAKFLGKDDPNYVRPRRFELVNKLKLVCYAGKTKCSVTGKNALTWKLIRRKNDRFKSNSGKE